MRSPTVTPPLQRLAAQAARDVEWVCTTLAPLSDADCLREASRHTSQARAPGLDGVTAEASAAPLDENLRDLHARLRRGRSQAAPVERVWIAKDDGSQRPIGPPAFAETIVQRAVARRLGALDAPDFLDCSEGLRPDRSPQEARHEGRERGRHEGMGWIVEAEGRGDGESMDSTRLREGRRQRVNAGSLWRLMGQWLRAGVREDGVRTPPATGVVQGGVLSPVLAKIGLHPVLEAWCERAGQPRLQGRRFLTRGADDGGIGCALEADAQKRMGV